MIGLLNHIAIAVEDLEAAGTFYRDILGAKVRGPADLPEHGVTILFVELPNTKIELMKPLGERSPLAGFMAKHPSGAIHHICFEVDNIDAACKALTEAGVRILGGGIPKIGAHAKEVLFLEPKDCAGTLIELEQR
ncbi:MAG: methylmalonyl-CoA epimerase [Methylocapsa sp.]|nr:methylmalonyl-CoA epimerase [Methylocapsa sp.]